MVVAHAIMPHEQLTVTLTEGIRKQIKDETDRLHFTSEGECVRHILVKYFEAQPKGTTA